MNSAPVSISLALLTLCTPIAFGAGSQKQGGQPPPDIHMTVPDVGVGPGEGIVAFTMKPSKVKAGTRIFFDGTLHVPASVKLYPLVIARCERLGDSGKPVTCDSDAGRLVDQDGKAAYQVDIKAPKKAREYRVRFYVRHALPPGGLETYGPLEVFAESSLTVE